MKKTKKRKREKKEYYETKRYHIIMDIFTFIAFLIPLILSILSINISFLVRNDTSELAKFSARPIYYDIKLFVNEDTKQSAVVTDKYLRLNLKLVVDDFRIQKKDYIDLNYNAIFTKVKYYMVYDYDLMNKDYKYMFYSLNDKIVGQLVYDDSLYYAPTEMSYSLTPNKEYCYILIYTETISEKNLDLVFFKYYDRGDSFYLDTIIENNVEKINVNRIDNDVYLCKEYYSDLWSMNNSKKLEDSIYMFDVYEDLKNRKL